MDILNNQLLQGGLVLGGITTILYSLRGLGQKVLVKLKERFIFRVVVYDYDELFYVLEDWIGRNYPMKYRNLEASYEKTRRYISSIPEEKEILRDKVISYKQEPNLFTLRYKGTRLLFDKTKKELEHAQDLKSAINFHYSISSWNKKKVQGFLQDITQEYNKTLNNNKLSIYCPNWESWKLVSKRRVKPLNEVILPNSIREFLIRDLDTFQQSRDWYENLNIVYKRGYLVYGPPGTGKTTLAQAMAAYLGKDICSLNLSSIGNDTALVNTFSNLPENALLLIEDIDCVFKGREPVNNETKITFSCLINCLDGAISKDGIITVITTNHLENLDSALIREGRMDIQLEMPLANTPEINEYLSLFYQEPIDIKEDIRINMSAVQEACIQNRDNSHKAICQILSK